MNVIEMNIETIRELCFKHNVGRLYAFGSVISNRFNNDSDVDFLVDFKDVELYNYADNYFELKYSLENLFQRHVDLLEDNAIVNPYLRQSIDLSKQQIYG